MRGAFWCVGLHSGLRAAFWCVGMHSGLRDAFWCGGVYSGLRGAFWCGDDAFWCGRVHKSGYRYEFTADIPFISFLMAGRGLRKLRVTEVLARIQAGDNRAAPPRAGAAAVGRDASKHRRGSTKHPRLEETLN